MEQFNRGIKFGAGIAVGFVIIVLASTMFIELLLCLVRYMKQFPNW